MGTILFNGNLGMTIVIYVFGTHLWDIIIGVNGTFFNFGTIGARYFGFGVDRNTNYVLDGYLISSRASFNSKGRFTFGGIHLGRLLYWDGSRSSFLLGLFVFLSVCFVVLFGLYRSFLYGWWWGGLGVVLTVY